MALKRVYKVDKGRPVCGNTAKLVHRRGLLLIQDETWPVSHIIDNSTLYVQLLSSIVAGKPLGYGKNGYYLASSGSVAWEDIYSAAAKAMLKRGLIEDDSLVMADNGKLEQMAR